MKIMRLFFLLFLCIPFSSCAKSLTAKMTVSVEIQSTTGATSAIANVNFTDFSQPAGPDGNDSKLRMRFTNPEGDQLDFVLTGNPEGIFQPGRYILDGSTNTFETSFTIVVDDQNQIITATTTNGFLDATIINLGTDGLLNGFEGTFRMNFADGTGTVEGNIGFNSES